MKLKIFLLLLFTALAIPEASDAQTPTLLDPANQVIQRKALEVDSAGVIYWNCDSLQVGDLFTTYFNATGLASSDSMALTKSWTDSMIGLQHYQYNQYYKGIFVEGATYTEHADECMVLITNGQVAEGLDLTNQPTLEEDDALNHALDHINAEIYYWEDDSLEYYLRLDSIPGYTTYYPQGELVYALLGDRRIISTNYKLAWKFTILGREPYINKNVYVDAINGEILKTISNIHEGSFQHIYYGINGFDTREINNNYRIIADDNGRNFRTNDNVNEIQNGVWKSTRMPKSGDDWWGLDNWSATASHYVIEKSWDFYVDVFERRGFDDNGREIRVASAGTRPTSFSPGPSNGWHDFIYLTKINNQHTATFDIAGHEYTHGVSQYSRPLEYESASGALSESFADIMGFMIERHNQGLQDWTLGEDLGFSIRDIQFPNNFNQPAWQFQPGFWINLVGCTPSGTNDWCGVHTNSGVQNRWFYLLSMGGTQLSVNVGAINPDKAANITYYSYTNFATPNETFQQARAHTIAAARLLYGTCSYEHNQTCLAWAAVNVGPACSPCAPMPTCWRGGCGGATAPVNTGMLDKNTSSLPAISAYPNPTNDFLMLDLKEVPTELLVNLEITIVGLDGKTVMGICHQDNQREIQIGLKNLPSGVYTLRITSAKWTQNLKVIKQ